jgi:hypothetical protein
MKTIQYDETGHGAGKFVLYNHLGTRVCYLGEDIDIRLRDVVRPKKGVKVTHLQYLIEVTRSLIHDPKDPFSLNKVAVFEVPRNKQGYQVCMAVFKKEAFGQTHRLGLQQYSIGQAAGYVLTVDGFLWDGRLLHVKDIVV